MAVKKYVQEDASVQGSIEVHCFVSVWGPHVWDMTIYEDLAKIQSLLSFVNIIQAHNTCK